MGLELFQVSDDTTLDDVRSMASKIKSGVFLLDKSYARGTNLVFDTNASSETDAVVYNVANSTKGLKTTLNLTKPPSSRWLADQTGEKASVSQKSSSATPWLLHLLTVGLAS